MRNKSKPTGETGPAKAFTNVVVGVDLATGPDLTALVVVRARRRPALPLCDVCKRPVERLDEEHDDFMQRRVFTARCHGRSERVILHFDEGVESVDPSAGVAFRQPKTLANAKK